MMQVGLCRIPDILEERYLHLQGLSGSRRLDFLGLKMKEASSFADRQNVIPQNTVI